MTGTVRGRDSHKRKRQPEADPPKAESAGFLRDGAIVFAAAFLVRLSVWLEIRTLPIVRSPQLDSLEYVEWARRIAAGDFTWPAPPPHGPGYPYFLGLLLAVSGSPAAIAVVQAAAGGLTCVLAAWLGRRFFGRGTGVLAGLLLAVSGAVAFLDVSTFSEGLLLLLATAVLVAIGPRGASPPTAWRAAGTGLLVGLAALVRPTALLLLPIAAWTYLRRSGRRGRGLMLAAVAASVCAVTILPVTLANLRTTGAPLLVQGHGGFNFFIGNSPSRDGLPSVRPGAEWDRLEGEALRHGQIRADAQDRYFMRKTFSEIRAAPAAFGRLLAAKLFWTIQGEEIRDPFSLAFFREEAPLLRFLPGFSLLFALSAVGVASAVRSDARPDVLFAAAGAWIASDVLLVTSFRYRAPVIPLLAVFAASGVVRLVADAKKGGRAFLPNAALFAAAFLVTRVWTHAPSHVFAEEWSSTGYALNHERDAAGAEAAFQKAVAADPRWSPAWAGLGVVASNRGDLRAAQVFLRKAIALEPHAVMPWLTLAQVEARAARPDQAEEAWRRVLEISPREAAALDGLARALLARGRPEEAERFARRASAVSPSSAAAHLLLARSLGALHRAPEGAAEAARAAELDPGGAEGWFTLGMLRLDSGNPADAEEAFARAEAAGADRRQIALGRALAQRARGDLAGAQRTIVEVFGREPSDPTARRVLSELSRARAAAGSASTRPR